MKQTKRNRKSEIAKTKLGRQSLAESVRRTTPLPPFVRVPRFLDELNCRLLLDECTGRQRFFRSVNSGLAKRVSIAYLEPLDN
jgi:hypothetical protein